LNEDDFDRRIEFGDVTVVHVTVNAPHYSVRSPGYVLCSYNIYIFVKDLSSYTSFKAMNIASVLSTSTILVLLMVGSQKVQRSGGVV